MTREEEIRQYLKERNIPITSLEANSIIEGIEWADKHPILSGYKGTLLTNFQRLLIFREAYWKLAGDWEPEFRFGKKKYSIMTKDNKVISATVEETNRILVFPTEEMRDAFYENFKELIELVKELL